MISEIMTEQSYFTLSSCQALQATFIQFWPPFLSKFVVHYQVLLVLLKRS